VPAVADSGSDGTSGGSGDGHVTALPADATPQDRAVAQARQTGQPVVVDALTTPYDQTTANPDGTLTQSSAPTPTRVLKDGAWVPIDPTLTAGRDGTLTAKASLNTLTLSSGGTGPLAVLTSPDGMTLTIGMPFALPAPVLDGATATYPDVLPDVDLAVTATDVGGIREVLVVKNAAAAANPALSALHLTTVAHGLTMRGDGQNSLEAVDASGAAHFAAPAPVMWDSTHESGSGSSPAAKAASRNKAKADTDVNARTTSGNATAGTQNSESSSINGPGTGAQSAVIPVTAHTDGIDLEPSSALLHGDNTHYPVYIDPSYLPWKAGDPTWTWAQSAHPTTDNFGQYGSSHAEQPGLGLCGTYAGGGGCSPEDKERTFYQFNTSGLHSVEDTIHSATLKVTQTYSADWSCTKEYTVHAYYSSNAIGHGTDWNHQPGGASLDTASVGGTGSTGCMSDVDFSFNALGGLRSVMGGTNPSVFTVALYGDESDANGFKRLSNKALLSVTYDATPNTPTGQTSTPTPRTASAGTTQPCDPTANSTTTAFLSNPGSTGLVLKAKVSSPTSPAQPVRGYFDLWNSSGTVATGYSSGYASSGTTVDLTVPTSKLTDGAAYGWDVAANDGILTSSPAPSAHCHFRADFTSPTVSLPSASTTLPESSLATTFPPSGNGQTTGVVAGGSGFVPFTATDPAPHGNPSGLACLRWGFDSALADATWQCGSHLPGNSGLPTSPKHWGTNILYVQAEDNAGNLSPVAEYSFYVPWNPHSPTPAYGDTTGDSAPDMLVPGTDGNLYAHTVPGNAQASSPAVGLASKQADSPAGDAWSGYQVAHRGSMRTGKNNVDDLIAHRSGAATMNLYFNPGNTGTDGRFDKSQTITKPPCDTCTGYATDWSTTTSIAATGDVTSASLAADGHFGHYTGLFTIENNTTGDAALWFYPTVSYGTLGAPVQIAATGWKGRDLISPGDWTGSGKPGLWARNRSTGEIDAYTLTLGTTDTDADGFPLDTPVPIVTGLSAPTKIGTLGTSDAVVIGSDGDLTGDGIADLWSVSGTGTLDIRPGKTADGTSHTAVTGTTSPYTIATTSGAADQWLLKGNTDDSGNGNPGAAHGTVTWGPGHTDAPGSAAVFDGSTSYITTAHPALDTTRSYTVSAWVKLDSTAATVTAVSQSTLNHQAFYLGYQKPTNSWYFSTVTTDNADGASFPAAIGSTRASNGTEQPPATNTWVLLTGVYDSATGVQTLYVNGVATGTAAQNTTPVYVPTGHLNIGANITATGTSPYNQWPGSVADVRTYQAALTADQVHQLYTSS
jgi:hypothetical protein